MTAGCASAPSSQTKQGAAQFVGFRWRVVEVHHGTANVRIPAALRGSVAFAHDHTLLASDSINGYFGHYRVEDVNSYRPFNMATTLVGWTGHDRSRRFLIDGVEALTKSGAVVTANVHGNVLRLATAGYRLTASREGVARNQAPPSPTALPS